MTTRNRILAAAAVAAVASLAFWLMIIAPKREEAAALSAQISEVQAEFEVARASLASYQTARDEYSTTYSTVTRLGKAVPSDDDIRSLLVQLNTAARRSHVDFRTINVGGGGAGPSAAGATTPPGAVASVGGFAQMPFEFSFEGRFFELSDFMSRLERFVTLHNDKLSVTGRLLALQAIELVPGADGFPALKAKVLATTYIVPPTAAVAGATAEGLAGAPAATAPPTTATGVFR